ncbi:hypothetical protein [Umezawaea beigongshangensis]|nr:hypothetical protein [Umezawaea beigongshangensis]
MQPIAQDLTGTSSLAMQVVAAAGLVAAVVVGLRALWERRKR